MTRSSEPKHLHLSMGLMPVLMASLLLCVVGSLSCRTFNSQVSQPTPTPTPHYLPRLSGRVFVTTEGNVWAIPFWSQPGFGLYGGHWIFAKPHGTSVEIIQSMWIARPGHPGCYYYLVRTDEGQSGWVDGQSLTADLNRPSLELCYEPPRLTPTHRVLARPAFLTTLGSQKEIVDFWNGPTLDKGDSHYLFSQPRGAQVDPIKYQFFTGPNGQTCRVYYVRTEKGLEGWVAEGWLTQNAGQPPMQVNCRE